MDALFEIDHHDDDAGHRGDADPEVVIDGKQREYAEYDPFVGFKVPEEPAFKRTGKRYNTKQRRYDKDCEVYYFNILQQQHWVVDEAVRQQVGGQRDPRRRYAGLRGTRARDARAGEGGKTDRRRQVGHNAKVEDEERGSTFMPISAGAMIVLQTI